MRLFGLTISRAKAAVPANLQSPHSRGGVFGVVRESYTGAWQKNVEVKTADVLTNSTVFRCISLIASDIAKMRIRLVEQDADGLWSEVENTAHSPVLRRPNRYQNRIQFIWSWMASLLVHGNTYVLKHRDQRGVVAQLYVLDPAKVKPLVAPDGAVFYEISRDWLSGIDADRLIVPASEMIHDRINAIYHPLVGLSPICANGLAAIQALKIQNNSARFFANGSNPGGVLTAPGAISDETAARLKAHWEANFSGENVGKVAVLGDHLSYSPMAFNAVDSQLIEQLKWSSETVCSCFGVPPYKAGVGSLPTLNNIEALDRQYYSQCLQVYIESIELCLDEGLELKRPLGTEFDLDDLLRMDTASMVEAIAKATGAGVMAPDEGRRKLGLKPTPGGDTPYLQQQNYSLAALAKRDAQDDPFGQTAAALDVNGPEPDDNEETLERFVSEMQRKAAERFAYA